MKKEIVVARYNEDTSWANQLPTLGYVTTIYNKLSGINLLPNVGREAHTYLTHIVNNYENLSDFIIFVQGNPFDHSTDFWQKLHMCSHNNYDFVFMSDGIITCDPNGRPGCGGYGRIHNPVGKHYEWITGKKSPQVFRSPSAAQFGISKKLIQHNSKEIYERALLSVSYENNPIEAHCLERSWASIFGLFTNLSYNDLNYYEDNELDVQKYLDEHVKNNEITLDGELGPYASK